MPNWCQNHLMIDGLLPEQISEISKKLSEPNSLLFESLVGKFLEDYLHDEKIVGITDEKENGKYFDWYKHNLSEYGTKWDVNLSNVYFQGDFTEMAFETAWSPPLEFARKLSKKYNAVVTLQFEEPGCDFGGEYIFENGEVIDYKDMTYMEWLFEEGGWDRIALEIEFYIDGNSLDEIKNIFSEYSFYDENKIEEIVSQLV